MNLTRHSRYKELQVERPGLFKQSPLLEIVLDYNKIKAYEEKNNCKIGVIYESRFNILVVDLVRDSKGNEFLYERVISANKENAVVAATVCNGKFLLLKQFRHSIREYQYAFPRGYAEKGLYSRQNVEKEVKEEAGSEKVSVKYIGYTVPDSGLIGNKVDIFLCNVDKTDIQQKCEGIADYKLVTKEEINKMVKQGEINDAFTLTALKLLEEQN